MSKSKYDLSRVPRATLEMFVSASIPVLNINDDRATDLGSAVLSAATVPLRTRAEVNADIVALVNDYVRAYDAHRSWGEEFSYRGKRESLQALLKPLLQEETSD